MYSQAGSLQHISAPAACACTGSVGWPAIRSPPSGADLSPSRRAPPIRRAPPPAPPAPPLNPLPPLTRSRGAVPGGEGALPCAGAAQAGRGAAARGGGQALPLARPPDTHPRRLLPAVSRPPARWLAAPLLRSPLRFTRATSTPPRALPGIAPCHKSRPVGCSPACVAVPACLPTKRFPKSAPTRRARSCLLSKCYGAAATLVEADIFTVDPTLTACTPTDVLLYCYYGALIEIGRWGAGRLGRPGSKPRACAEVAAALGPVACGSGAALAAAALARPLRCPVLRAS